MALQDAFVQSSKGGGLGAKASMIGERFGVEGEEDGAEVGRAAGLEATATVAGDAEIGHRLGGRSIEAGLFNKGLGAAGIDGELHIALVEATQGDGDAAGVRDIDEAARGVLHADRGDGVAVAMRVLKAAEVSDGHSDVGLAIGSGEGAHGLTTREAKVAAAKHVTKITAKANKKAGKKSNLAKLDRKGKAAKARVARYDRDQ